MLPSKASHHSIEFEPSGRGQAQCEPNPSYPHGIHVGGAMLGVPACTVDLPYPAPECGLWVVRCENCSMSVAVTAAGRPDDPLTVTIECKKAK